jgi:PLP dependent protein
VDDPRGDSRGDSRGDPRAVEIAANLARVRQHIAQACADVGRDPAQVTVVAVTKTFPAADVVRVLRLGIPDIGENRDQEAAPKLAEVLAKLSTQGVRPRVHFVGRLQRNKVSSVVRYADVVQSVDSVRLATALGTAAHRAGRERPLEVLVQVSLDGDPARGGAPETEVPAVAAAVAGQASLRLRGVMAVAPLSWQPRIAYRQLAEISRRLRTDHPDATIISAGMSGDLDAALACGATHLRLGTALLGKRPPLR